MQPSHRATILMCAAVSASALAWDPSAPAADIKRLLLLVLALGALGVLLTRAATVRLPRAGLAWLALTAWAGIGLLWGSRAGVRDVAIWAGAGALLAIRSWIPEPLRMPAVRLTALMTGGGAALLAASQYALGARGILVHGGQGNGNWLGLLLAVTLPLSVEAWVRRTGGRGQRAAILLSCLPQAAALIVSHSRVAWVALLTALAAWALLEKASRRWIAAVGVAACLLAAIGAARGTGEFTVRDVSASWQGRVWIWQGSATLAGSSLPLGAGTGRFAEQYLRVQGERLSGMEPRRASRRFENATTAHQDWIQTTAEHGLIGLACLAAAMGWGLLAAWRARWAGGVAALVALAVCAAGDSPLRQPAIVAVFAMILMALPGQELAVRLAGRDGRSLARRAGLAAGFAALSVLVADASRCWIGSRAVTRAKEQVPVVALRTLDRAVRVDCAQGEAWLALGLARLESGEPELALAALQRSRSLLPNVGTDIALGNACMALSRPDCAIDAYRSALGLHPGAFRAHANLAKAYAAAGNPDAAGAHLSIARTLWPGNPHLPDIEQEIAVARAEL